MSLALILQYYVLYYLGWVLGPKIIPLTIRNLIKLEKWVLFLNDFRVWTIARKGEFEIFS